MPYKVVIIVKDSWYSDQKPFATFKAAQAHRRDNVAPKWNTSETAILAPDGRVLAYQESRKFQAEMKALKAS